MNKNEYMGQDKQQDGREKEAQGRATGDTSLKYEGKLEQAEGVIQENFGKAQRKVGDFIDDIAKKIKD